MSRKYAKEYQTDVQTKEITAPIFTQTFYKLVKASSKAVFGIPSGYLKWLAIHANDHGNLDTIRHLVSGTTRFYFRKKGQKMIRQMFMAVLFASQSNETTVEILRYFLDNCSEIRSDVKSFFRMCIRPRTKRDRSIYDVIDGGLLVIRNPNNRKMDAIHLLLNYFDDYSELWKNCCILGDLVVLETLLAKPEFVQINEENGIGMKMAILNQNLELVNWLYERGADLTIDGGVFLGLACGVGNTKIVQFFIDNAPETLNAKNDFAFRIACRNGHLDIVKCLVELGVNPQTCNNYGLNVACCFGHLEIVKYLVENGADIHESNDLPLCQALAGSHKRVIAFLQEQGAFVSDFNKNVMKELKRKDTGLDIVWKPDEDSLVNEEFQWSIRDTEFLSYHMEMTSAIHKSLDKLKNCCC